MATNVSACKYVVCGHNCCSFTHTKDQEMARQAMLSLKRFRQAVEQDGSFYSQQWNSLKKELEPLEQLMIPEKASDGQHPRTPNVITLLHLKMEVAKSKKYIRDYANRAISACEQFNRDHVKRDAIPWTKNTKTPPGFRENDKLPMAVWEMPLLWEDDERMSGVEEELRLLRKEHEALKTKMMDVEAKNKTLLNALNSVHYIVKGAFIEETM